MSISSAQNNLVDIPPRLIEALHSVQYIAVLTGAGISAETAMPTNTRRHSYAYADTDTNADRDTDCNS